MPFERCGNTAWYKNTGDLKEKDVSLQREFVSPLFEQVQERRYDRPNYEGFTDLTVTRAIGLPEQLRAGIEAVSSERQEIFQKWLSDLSVFSLGPATEAALEGFIDNFNALPEDQKEGVLTAINEVFAHYRRARREGEWTSEPSKFPFPAEETNTLIIEKDSRAHQRFQEVVERMAEEGKDLMAKAKQAVLPKVRRAVYEGEPVAMVPGDFDIVMDWSQMKDAKVEASLTEAIQKVLDEAGIGSC